MARKIKMKCSNCGYWNRVPVNKIFIEQPNPIEAKWKFLNVRRLASEKAMKGFSM